MLEYFLTEEQQMMVETAKEIAEKKIVPVRAEYDENQTFPNDVFKAIADADLTGVYIPEEYGGCSGDTPIMNMCLVTEELSKACGGISLAFAGSALGTLPIILSGGDEQKQRWLPKVASGTLAAFGITESDAGSDAASMRTTAVKDGGDYIINGSKMFITNGGEAEIYSIFAMTDKNKGARGCSCFVLEKGMPGFEFGKKEDKMGIRASATRELIFQDCRVPAANMLGREGSGFMTAMKTFDNSRPGVGSQALGIAAGALELAVEYARQRKQFGRPIIANQGLQWMLADMAMQVEAARALIYATARWIDSGAKRPTGPSAMAKCFASDVAMKVAIDAIQVFGGVGYTKEYPIEKYARDAKITQIYEGTNQIQRDEIALALIKEAARK
ncbi:MAG: acyl-CoA dehydrogenase family protein [Planctomycetota bacterium]|jgi:butyryl-CoA dehydrogenase|nr:acyl-CoA dehydrogenase family protein [Planctomycetota bacterium]